MKDFLKKLSFLAYADNEGIECSALLYDTISDFLEFESELSVDLFYAARGFLEYMSKKRNLPVDDFMSVEKNITTIDEVVTKLQIPKMSFSGSRLAKKREVYTTASDLYDDLRKVLLNQDGVRVFHKEYVHGYVLIMARLVSEEMEKYDLEETVDLGQLRNLIKMVIGEFSKEEDKEKTKEYQEWIFTNNNQIISDLVRKYK